MEKLPVEKPKEIDNKPQGIAIVTGVDGAMTITRFNLEKTDKKKDIIIYRDGAMGLEI